MCGMINREQTLIACFKVCAEPDGFLAFSMKGSRCWLPSFFESLTVNPCLLLEVKFSKWDMCLTCPLLAQVTLRATFLGFVASIKVNGSEQLRFVFQTDSSHESLRLSKPNTNFILGAWVVKLRSYVDIDLVGLYLWASFCKLQYLVWEVFYLVFCWIAVKSLRDLWDWRT